MLAMQRRGFLGSILAACMAPAIVRASSLMPGRALTLSDGGIIVGDSIMETIMTTGGNLMTGDIITIAGVKDAYGRLVRFRTGLVSAGSTQLEFA
jgi:hypothetical protein